MMRMMMRRISIRATVAHDEEHKHSWKNGIIHENIQEMIH